MVTCIRCKRPLSDPESIKRGIGPMCYSKIKAEEEKEQQQEIFIPFNGDIICKRLEEGLVFNIPHRYIKHSPTGMEWGYGGSGPADFALNALTMYIGREKAEENGLYQEFKRDFIAKLPYEGGIIKYEDVMNWLSERGVV